MQTYKNLIEIISGFKPILIKRRSRGVINVVAHNANHFYLFTNENAQNFRLLRRRVNGTETEWGDPSTIFIPENREMILDFFSLTKNFLLLKSYNRLHGLPILQVRHLQSGKTKTLVELFPDAIYDADIFTTNFEDDDIRIHYSSPLRPATYFAYDFETNTLRVLKETKIRSGFEVIFLKILIELNWLFYLFLL